MATALPEISITLAIGESFDVAIDVPLDYGWPLLAGENAVDPREDDSVFAVAFKADRAEVGSAIRFASDVSTPPRLSLGDWDEETNKLTLAFQASAARAARLAPGEYEGDIMHARPRAGVLGPQVSRVALVKLTVIQGT